MLVLVDTPIGSLALGRKDANLSSRELSLTQALRELIQDGRAQLVGPVLQELLSGVREEASFKRLRDQLRAFEQASLDFADYEEAARLNNQAAHEASLDLRSTSSFAPPLFAGAGRFSLLTMISSATAQYFPCDSTK